MPKEFVDFIYLECQIDDRWQNELEKDVIDQGDLIHIQNILQMLSLLSASCSTSSK